MNDFIQIDEYLTRKLKENCDEFHKFLLNNLLPMIESSNFITQDKIKKSHDFARDMVRDLFIRDCNKFKEMSNFLESKRITEMVDFNLARGLKKIDSFAKHKHNVLCLKFNIHAGEVVENTFCKGC